MEKVKIVSPLYTPVRAMEYDCMKLLSNRLVSADEFRTLCKMISAKDEDTLEMAKQLIIACSFRQGESPWKASSG